MQKILNLRFLLHKINLNTMFIVILLALFSIVIHGYSYGTGDQTIYIPLYTKLLDDSLYPKDYLFPVTYGHKTLAYDVLLFLARWFRNDFFYPYLILYISGTIFFYFGVYTFIRTLFSRRKIAFLSLFLISIPIPIGGAAISTAETGFTLRLWAQGLLFYILSASYKKKWKITIILLLAMFLIHPLSFAVYSLLLIPLILFNSITSEQIIFLGLSGTLLIGGMSLWLFPEIWIIQKIILQLNAPEWWINILRLRNSYAFPHLWSLQSWVILFISLLPLFYFLCVANKNLWIRRFVMQILIICFSLQAIQYFFTSLYPLPTIIILQLGRVWYVPVMISIIFISNYLISATNKGKFPASRRIILIILISVLVGYRNPGQLLLSQNKDWIDIQKWTKEHTSKNCTFLTNFYSQGFRVYSERSIVGEYKDGTISFYSMDFARNWYEKRIKLQADESGKFVNSFEEIRRLYPFSFVVLNRGIPAALEKVYENDSFLLYKNPQMETDCEMYL